MKILDPEPGSLAMGFALDKAVQCKLNAPWLVHVLFLLM